MKYGASPKTADAGNSSFSEPSEKASKNTLTLEMLPRKQPSVTINGYSTNSSQAASSVHTGSIGVKEMAGGTRSKILIF